MTARRWWPWVRTLLILAPFPWLWSRIEVSQVGRALRETPPRVLAAAICLHLLGVALASVRWRELLRVVGGDGAHVPRLGYLFRSVLGAAWAALLPLAGADEVFRSARTAGAFEGAVVTSAAVVALERTVGLAALISIGLLGWLVVEGPSVGPALVIFTLGLALTFVLSLLTLGTPRFIDWSAGLRSWLAKRPRLERWAGQLPRVTRLRVLVVPWLLSIAVQLCFVTLTFLVLSSIDGGVTFATVLRVQPSVQLLLAIPITPAAIGQRELAFVTLYGAAGVSSSDALSASLIVFAVSTFIALCGGLAIALEKRASPAP